MRRKQEGAPASKGTATNFTRVRGLTSMSNHRKQLVLHPLCTRIIMICARPSVALPHNIAEHGTREERQCYGCACHTPCRTCQTLPSPNILDFSNCIHASARAATIYGKCSCSQSLLALAVSGGPPPPSSPTAPTAHRTRSPCTAAHERDTQHNGMAH